MQAPPGTLAHSPAAPQAATELFQQLRECWALINEFLELPLTIHSVDRGVFVKALVLSKKYRLFINDATHIALMAEQGIEFLATFDHDLERVDFITCCG
ncbi:MAG: PIN domain-containing protein [Anaerolineales bacterium]|nr:MAG: PIN domain-containing protein [Anaerolineales bacterium]